MSARPDPVRAAVPPLDRESIGNLFADLASSAWIVRDQLHTMIGNDDTEGAAGTVAIVAQMGALADRCASILGAPVMRGLAEVWILSPRAVEALAALRGSCQAEGGAA